MQEKNTKLPDLPDMMNAGMGLSEALAFWNRMMNTPGHGSAFWWSQTTSGQWKTLSEKAGNQVLH